MEIKQSAEYRKWFKKLRDHKAKAAIQARLDACKLAGRPFGDIKPVGGPVSEMRFHTGAGYRVYFAMQGNVLMLLLAGGDKSTQQTDIRQAHEHPQRLQGTTTMSTEFTDYDTSEYLENEQDIIAYLNAIAEYDDPALMQAALGNVAKARGMTQIAKDAGGRESLYKSLSKDGNPSFQTIAKVIHALGGRLTIQAA